MAFTSSALDTGRMPKACFKPFRKIESCKRKDKNWYETKTFSYRQTHHLRGNA